MTTKQDAVDFLEREIDKTTRRRQPVVTLPLSVARLVLACAKQGVHKGEGRKGVELTRSDRLRRNNIYNRARTNYHTFRARGVPAADAKNDAIAEARQFGIERYGIDMAASTIERNMFAAAGLRPRIVSNLSQHT